MVLSQYREAGQATLDGEKGITGFNVFCRLQGPVAL